MRFFLVGVLLVAAAFVFFISRFPSCDHLKPDAKGMIHHPFYGTYPAVVDYQDGMTLRPCQSAVGKLNDIVLESQ